MILRRESLSGHSVAALSLTPTCSGRPQKSFQLPLPRRHGLQCLEVEEETLNLSLSFDEYGQEGCHWQGDYQGLFGEL